MQDPDFPHPEFTAAGYHSVFSGQKTYNGVALLSRLPMTDFVRDIPDFDDPPRRVLAANIGAVPRHQPLRAQRPGAGLGEVRLQAEVAGGADALAARPKPRSIRASWC